MAAIWDGLAKVKWFLNLRQLLKHLKKVPCLSQFKHNLGGTLL
ncbi:UNVERIFIED_CONTAM: hypothetical protein GTU68_006097, partial [Idotea baltica]|nr:hypothetical protein [Idotea baltica]